MGKTATLGLDGLYSLSDIITPFGDGLCFARVAIHTPSTGRVWLLGVSPDGQEHPSPLIRTDQASSPGAALAVLGYTLV